MRGCERQKVEEVIRVRESGHGAASGLLFSSMMAKFSSVSSISLAVLWNMLLSVCNL